MKRIILLMIGFVAFMSSAQNNDSIVVAKNTDMYFPENPSFTGISTTVTNFFFPSLDWGDYDNDGDLDFVISGGVDTTNNTFADTSIIKLYQNTNGTFTEVATPNIYGLHLGAVKFVDIDNDKDLDLITGGQNYTNITTYFLTVYENNNGTFTTKQQLSGTIYSSIDIGDYDNDGDLDLLVTGANQTASGSGVSTKIYTNTNANFVDSGISLPGVQNGTAQFGDFDLDSDLDIILMGLDENSTYVLKTYTNANGSFTELQSLPGMYLGWLALGDYDNDGDLDFAVMGDDTNDDYAAALYTNNNGSFALSSVSLTGIDSSSGTSSIAWGDQDNDGDLDLIMAGTDDNYNDVTFLYENNAGTFTKLTNTGIQDVGGNTSLGWSDFDGDLDLDLIISGLYTNTNSDYIGGTFLYTNDVTTTNQKPSAPSNLMSTINSDNSITFQWDQSTDDNTPTNGLYYWITVGTTNNGAEIASYKIQGTSWTIKNLGSVNYYWSVQAVDTSFILSDKASAQTLSVDKFGNPLTAAVAIYPNPTDAVVHILNSSNKKIEALSVYDMQGKEIMFINSDSISKIDVSQFSKGVYILHIQVETSIITKKLIVK